MGILRMCKYENSENVLLRECGKMGKWECDPTFPYSRFPVSRPHKNGKDSVC